MIEQVILGTLVVGVVGFIGIGINTTLRNRPKKSVPKIVNKDLQFPDFNTARPIGNYENKAISNRNYENKAISNRNYENKAISNRVTTKHRKPQAFDPIDVDIDLHRRNNDDLITTAAIIGAGVAISNHDHYVPPTHDNTSYGSSSSSYDSGSSSSSYDSGSSSSFDSGGSSGDGGGGW